MVGKCPGRHGPRAKKGSGPRGGAPTESVTAHHRLRAVLGFLDFVHQFLPLPASHPHFDGLLTGQTGYPHHRAPSRSHRSASWVRVLCRARDPLRNPLDNSAVKCARSSWLCWKEARAATLVVPSRRIEARRGSRFGPYLLYAYPLARASPFAALRDLELYRFASSRARSLT